MNPGIRIQTGKWKGRSLPIPPKVKGNSHFTPAILKKSVFSRIGAWVLKGQLDLSNSAFIDLFAGSGQMGAEALSIGFSRGIFLELSQERFGGLLRSSALFGDKAQFLRKDGFRYHQDWEIPAQIESLVYYLDPPYVFWERETERIRYLVESILSIPDYKIFVFLQGPDRPQLEGIASEEFGANRLYVWEGGMPYLDDVVYDGVEPGSQ